MSSVAPSDRRQERAISAAARLALLGLAGVISLGGGAWLVGDRQSAPANSAVAAAAPPASDIELVASDGLRIAGTFYPGARSNGPAVLLLHGNDGSRASMADAAQWLAGQGYAVLAIDFRGHGESAKVDRSFGFFEARDAHAAFAWLKQRQQGAPVAIIGSSLGGAAAMIGEDGPIAADALVLQAVYPDIRSAIHNRLASRLGGAAAMVLEPMLSYQSRLRIGVWPDRLAPIVAIRQNRSPLLVIGSTGDRYTPPSETQALFDAASGDKQLWLVDGQSHEAMTVAGDGAWRDRVGRFLVEKLG